MASIGAVVFSLFTFIDIDAFSVWSLVESVVADAAEAAFGVGAFSAAAWVQHGRAFVLVDASVSV